MITDSMFRKAVISDIPAMSRIFIDSWQTTYQTLLPKKYLQNFTYKWAIHYFSDYFSHKENGAYVAIDNDENVVGFVNYMPFIHEIPECILLDSLHVSPVAQGKGIGKELVFMVGKYGYRTGFKKMVLSLIIGNKRAEDFYYRLGAVHLKDKEEFFNGYFYNGRFLIWKDISVFLPAEEKKSHNIDNENINIR